RPARCAVVPRPAAGSGTAASLRGEPMNQPAVWFRRAVWVGVLIDWVLGLPAIFAPDAMLRLLGFSGAREPVWAAFASLLLVLNSLFYLTAANDPYGHRFNAWVAVLARLANALFFLLLYQGQYALYGIVGLVLFLVQLPLFVATLRSAPPPAAVPSSPQAFSIEVQDDRLPYDGATFAYVKEAALAGEYDTLPHHSGLGLSTMLQFF